MNNPKKNRIITFRVTEAQHALIQNAAAAAAVDVPNNWCRQVALRYAHSDQESTIEGPTANPTTPQSSIGVSPNPLSIPKNSYAIVSVTLSPCGSTNVSVKTF